MRPNFHIIYSILFLLISCGGSKSDINDPILSNTNNTNTGNTNNTNTGNTNNTNTGNTNTTQSYTFNNELVWRTNLINHFFLQINGT